MWNQILPGLRIKILFTILLGVIYPLVLTGICQGLFPHKANGSLVVASDGRVIGSQLIGQNFMRPGYFHPRPSAAGKDGYDAVGSNASNFGPTSQKLVERVEASLAAFRKENPDYRGPIPADLATASASGLDPHISPVSAEAQVPRVAAARGMSTEQVRRLVDQATDRPDLGLLGEPRVNVLMLNLLLDHEGPAAR